MRVMLDVAHLLETTDLRSLMLRIADSSARLLGTDTARIYLHEPGAPGLWTVTQDGPGQVVGTVTGPVEQAFLTGQVTAATEPSPASLAAGRPDRAPAQQRLCAPLRDLDGKSIGVVEVVRLRRGFTPEERIAIQLLAEHAAVAIQRYRLLLAAAHGSELQREMELARRVQEALVPVSPPAIPGLECVGWTRPASITGGDCFDLWRVADGRMAVLVGDASGHGLAAALVISQVRAMLRALCEVQTDPARLLASVNARLVHDLVEGRFVTAFFGCLSSEGFLQWGSAGQGPILVRASAEAPFVSYQAPAVPLGVAAHHIADPVPPVILGPGGMLAAMTDGVFEARSPAGEMLGAARVAAILDEHASLELGALLETLQAAIRDWQGSDQPVDDQTIVLVRKAL